MPPADATFRLSVIGKAAEAFPDRSCSIECQSAKRLKK